jgi:hypothetical protein
LDAPAGAAGFKNWASLGRHEPSTQGKADETPAPGRQSPQSAMKRAKGRARGFPAQERD